MLAGSPAPPTVACLASRKLSRRPLPAWRLWAPAWCSRYFVSGELRGLF
jgi:hypothetical protein